MSPNLKANLFRLALLPLTAILLVASGCTASMNSATQSATGPLFLVGTDAPMAAVTSFPVTVNSITATNTANQSVTLLNSATNVDFARYNGLQALLDINNVTPGTYTSVTITLGSGTIYYLNTGSGAPTIANMPATIVTNPVTVQLSKPLVVGVSGSAPVGLRIDFNLAKSIETTNGQINGKVNPTFDVQAVANTDEGGHIDEYVAGVVSVNQSAQSFVVQGPHGGDFTINVSSSTEWDGDASLSMLAGCTGTCIVQVSGKMDRADQTLDADEVAVLTDTGFYATGQITYVTPATSFQLFVRGLEPVNTGLTLGQIANVELTGNETYDIYWMHDELTQFLFNQSSLVAGQDVAIGGPASGATNASDVTVKRIHLREWGFNGTITAVPNATNGTFTMTVNGFAGVLIPQTVTVYLGPECDFRDGLGESGFSSLANGASVRVVGLLLYDSSNGQTVLLARHVDGLNFTDSATSPWE